MDLPSVKYLRKSCNPMRIVHLSYKANNGHRYEKDFRYSSDFKDFFEKKGRDNLNDATVTTASGQQFDLIGGYWENDWVKARPIRIFHEVHIRNVAAWTRDCDGYREVWQAHGPKGMWC